LSLHIPSHHREITISVRQVDNTHAKGRTNVIGALVGAWLIAVGLFESSVNADVFLAWIRPVLLPQLSPTAVIVLDNATFHKRADVQNVRRQAGHTLE